MSSQEKLLFLTKEELKSSITNKIRGVITVWEDPTAHIYFYFDGEITEQDREDASDVCTYIIAHFPNGLLEENYIRMDYPEPLPESPYWAYKKIES
jgi:hypothetical protein